MFQLDDNFLKDLGLGGLPDNQKKSFLEYVYEQLEVRVGTKLSDGLSERQMDEFEAFLNQDDEKVRDWIAQNVPDYAARDDYKKMREAAAGVSEASLLADYGSLRWLEINCPNYREVVATEIELLKKEISENRDVILANAGQ